jgi:hypothetical protein
MPKVAINGTPSTANGVFTTSNHPATTGSATASASPPNVAPTGVATPDTRNTRPVRLFGRARTIAAPTSATAR